MDQENGEALQAPEPESVESGHHGMEADRLLTRSVQAFSGPLPPPLAVREYDDIIPGGAERILVMAEKEQSHRHENESLISKETMKLRGKGQNFALFISLAVLATAIYFGSIGQGTIAAVIVTIDIVALASIFHFGKALAPKEKSDSSED